MKNPGCDLAFDVVCLIRVPVACKVVIDVDLKALVAFWLYDHAFFTHTFEVVSQLPYGVSVLIAWVASELCTGVQCMQCLSKTLSPGSLICQ